MKKENTFWGVLFIIGAVFLITSNLGWFHTDVNLWTIILTIGFCAWLVKSIAKVEFFGIFISAAFLGIIYDDFLHIQAITPWPLLGAAVLLGIGCNMLFPTAHKKYIHNHNRTNVVNESGDVNTMSGDCMSYEVTFKSAVNYINSDQFEQADLSCSFGSLKVYFDHAVMAGNEANLFIANNFGGMDLYVPRAWKVNNQLDCTFGGVEEKGANANDWDGVHVLNLKGDTNFGGIVIYYV